MDSRHLLTSRSDNSTRVANQDISFACETILAESRTGIKIIGSAHVCVAADPKLRTVMRANSVAYHGAGPEIVRGLVWAKFTDEGTGALK